MGAKGSKAKAPAYPAGFPGAGYAPAYPGAVPVGAAVPAPVAAPVAAAPFAGAYGAYGAYPAYPPVGGLYDGIAPPSYSAYAPAGSFGPAAVIPPTVLQQQVVAPMAPVVAAPVVAAPTQYQTVSPAFFQGLNTGVAYPYTGATGTFTVPPSPAYSTYGAAPVAAPFGTTLY